MIDISISVDEILSTFSFNDNISAYEDICFSKYTPNNLKMLDKYTNIEYEKNLSTNISLSNYNITLKTNVSALYYTDSIPNLINIVKFEKNNKPKSILDIHKYQNILGAFVLLNDSEYNQVKLKTIYIDQNENIIFDISQTLSKIDILSESSLIFKKFILELDDEYNSEKIRNESIELLKFPFKTFRRGQKELVLKVYDSILNQKKFFASLATGTGKTIATIYPAIKAMYAGYTNKIVYLTARTSAKQSPIKALESLLSEGMKLKILIITAKEKTCINSTINCCANNCSYAKGHYSRQKDAIDSIKEYDIWDYETIHKVSIAHNVCPYELSISLSKIADFIICDYNYVFDPFVANIKISQSSKKTTVLIDEAHHLLDRVRNSMSISLYISSIVYYTNVIYKNIKNFSYIEKIYYLLIELEEIINSIEYQNNNNIIQSIPNNLYEVSCNIKDEALFILESQNIPEIQLEETLLNIYNFFNKFVFIMEKINSNYKIIFEKNNDIELTLFCIDPSKKIQDILKKACGAIFFSATLNPIDKIKMLIGGEQNDESISVSSPFPKENLLVVNNPISTYYKDREYSAPEIALTINKILKEKEGNFIAFFPSYYYLDLVKPYIEVSDERQILTQDRSQNEQAKEEFIKKFSSNNNIFAMCVLGGSFSEAIDLPGKMLIGVFIIGVGLDAMNLKSDILTIYYDKLYGDGYLYSYIYPAMHKVLQACGRLIRGKDDKGIIVLIDKRYNTYRYKSLLPKEWKIHTDNIFERIHDFNI